MPFYLSHFPSDFQQSAGKESRIHKFIIRACFSSPDARLDAAVLDKLGVQVKSLTHVACAGSKKNRMLVMVCAKDGVKYSRLDVQKKLFGDDEIKCPYNQEARSEVVTEKYAVCVLGGTGETKEEYKELCNTFFKESAPVKKKSKRAVEEEDEDDDTTAMKCMEAKVAKILEAKLSLLTAGSSAANDSLALTNAGLAEENTGLRVSLSTLSSEKQAMQKEMDALRTQHEEMRKENEYWMGKKESFDRLTLGYAEWRYDLKEKDEEIVKLKAENAELSEELKRMTDRRDLLQKRMEGV